MVTGSRSKTVKILGFHHRKHWRGNTPTSYVWLWHIGGQEGSSCACWGSECWLPRESKGALHVVTVTREVPEPDFEKHCFTSSLPLVSLLSAASCNKAAYSFITNSVAFLSHSSVLSDEVLHMDGLSPHIVVPPVQRSWDDKDRWVTARPQPLLRHKVAVLPGEVTWAPRWRSARPCPVLRWLQWPEAAGLGTAVHLTEWWIARQSPWGFIPQALACFLLTTQVDVRSGPGIIAAQEGNGFTSSCKGEGAPGSVGSPNFQ